MVVGEGCRVLFHWLLKGNLAMTPRSSLLSLEDRLELWLDAAGWSGFPFGVPGNPTTPVTVADQEKEFLEQYLFRGAIRSGWPRPSENSDEDIGYFEELTRKDHAILFAQTGEGKSACRIVLGLEAEKRNFIVIPYLDMDRGDNSLETHAASIINLLYDIEPSLPKVGTTQSRIAELRRLMRELGSRSSHRGVFVLIDNIAENLGPLWKVPDMEHAIRNLFDPRLLGIDQLWLKFFLNIELSLNLTNYGVFTRGHPHFCIAHVRWTENQLRSLLADRLGQVTDYPELQMLAERDPAFGFHDLDGEIVREASMYRGAPRNLNRLVHELIISRARQFERENTDRTDSNE